MVFLVKSRLRGVIFRYILLIILSERVVGEQKNSDAPVGSKHAPSSANHHGQHSSGPGALWPGSTLGADGHSGVGSTRYSELEEYFWNFFVCLFLYNASSSSVFQDPGAAWTSQSKCSKKLCSGKTVFTAAEWPGPLSSGSAR